MLFLYFIINIILVWYNSKFINLTNKYANWCKMILNENISIIIKV